MSKTRETMKCVGRPVTVLALAGALVCLAPRLTHAQSGQAGAPQTPDEAKRQAVDHLKRGWAAYKGKRYGDALLSWTESVQLYPAAPTYLNMAEAHLALDQLDEALAALGKARSAVVLPLDAQGRRGANDLELRVEQRRAQVAEEARRRAQRERFIEEQSVQRVTRWTYVGAASAALGLGTLGASLYFNNESAKLLRGLQPPQPFSREEYARRREELEREQSRAISTAAIGTALVAVGAGLLIWDLSTVEQVPLPGASEALSERPRVQVLVAPTSAQLRLSF